MRNGLRLGLAFLGALVLVAAFTGPAGANCSGCHPAQGKYRFQEGHRWIEFEVFTIRPNELAIRHFNADWVVDCNGRQSNRYVRTHTGLGFVSSPPHGHLRYGEDSAKLFWHTATNVEVHLEYRSPSCHATTKFSVHHVA